MASTIVDATDLETANGKARVLAGLLEKSIKENDLLAKASADNKALRLENAMLKTALRNATNSIHGIIEEM